MKRILAITLLLLLNLYPEASAQTRPSILGVRPISTVGDLRLLRPTTPGQWAFVSGHTTEGDSGGGDFWWDSTSTLEDDNGLVIKPNVGYGRWIRRVNGDIPVAAFGIFPSSGDVSGATNAAIAAVGLGATLVFGQVGVYQMDAPLVISVPVTIKGVSPGVPQYEFSGGATLDFSNASAGVIFEVGYVGIADINITGGVAQADRELVTPSTRGYGKIGILFERSTSVVTGGTRVSNVGISRFGTGMLFTHETLGTYGGSYWNIDNIRFRANGAALVVDSYITDLRLSNIHNSDNDNYDLWVSSPSGYQNVSFVNSLFEGAGQSGNFDYVPVATGTWEDVGLFVGENSKVGFVNCYFEGIKLFVGRTSSVRFSGGHFHSSCSAFGFGAAIGLETILGKAVDLPLPDVSTWDINTSTGTTILESTTKFLYSGYDAKAVKLTSSDTTPIVISSPFLFVPTGASDYRQALGAPSFGLMEVSYAVASPTNHIPGWFSGSLVLSDDTSSSAQTSGTRDFRGYANYTNGWVTAWAVDYYRRGGSYGTSGKPYKAYKANFSISNNDYGVLDFSTVNLNMTIGQPRMTLFLQP